MPSLNWTSYFYPTYLTSKTNVDYELYHIIYTVYVHCVYIVEDQALLCMLFYLILFLHSIIFFVVVTNSNNNNYYLFILAFIRFFVGLLEVWMAPASSNRSHFQCQQNSETQEEQERQCVIPGLVWHTFPFLSPFLLNSCDTIMWLSTKLIY